MDEEKSEGETQRRDSWKKDGRNVRIPAVPLQRADTVEILIIQLCSPTGFIFLFSHLLHVFSSHLLHTRKQMIMAFLLPVCNLYYI